MSLKNGKTRGLHDEDHKESLSFLAARDTRSNPSKESTKSARQHYYRYCALRHTSHEPKYIAHDVDEYWLSIVRWSRTQRELQCENLAAYRFKSGAKALQPLFELTNISLTEHHMTPQVSQPTDSCGAVGESTEQERAQSARLCLKRLKHCGGALHSAKQPPPQIGAAT
jgi:hypothetical protein